jgi:hypothetical protein
LVQAFLKKWWVESDFKAPNQCLSTRNSSDVSALNTNFGRDTTVVIASSKTRDALKRTDKTANVSRQ